MHFQIFLQIFMPQIFRYLCYTTLKFSLRSNLPYFMNQMDDSSRSNCEDFNHALFGDAICSRKVKYDWLIHKKVTSIVNY